MRCLRSCPLCICLVCWKYSLKRVRISEGNPCIDMKVFKLSIVFRNHLRSGLTLLMTETHVPMT